MAMFWEFFTFELKFRLKSISTYVYFFIWFALSFFYIAAEDFISIGNGKVLENGPFANSVFYLLMSFTGIFIIAAIFGMSILRDFQHDTIQIIFTKPINKLSYLGGRWAGSFFISILIFSGLFWGERAGTLAPWADHSRIVSGHLWWYVQPFLSIVCVQIFVLGSLFFCIAALTRKLFIVYLQGVVLFMLYLIVSVVLGTTHSLEHFWSGIFDPIGMRLLDIVTRYWTVSERNTRLLTWTGVFLYNRLVWIGIGIASLGLAGGLFPMSVEMLTAKMSGKRAAKLRENEITELGPRRSLVAAKLPHVRQVFGPGTTWQQFQSLTRIRIRAILHEIPFWAFVGLIFIYSILNGFFAGKVADQDVWPVTYLMLQAVEGTSTLFFFIVITLYAGELVWAERDHRFSGIHDALPMRESTDWLSKLSALGLIELALLTITMACGILMQTVAGYYHYELLHYFKELYVITFVQIMTMALLALFLQTVVSNKFLAHGMMIAVFLSQGVLFRFGWENRLYIPGATAPSTYSDMNGYGYFVPALAWSLVYWLSIMGFLGVVSIALARRGADDTWGSRLRVAGQRARGLAPFAVVLFLTAIGSGSWYYYNAHVRNEYRNSKMQRDIQAQYERDFKQYQRLPQPKVISVDAAIDIYPRRRAIGGTGHYVLQNKTALPISQIHITNQQHSIQAVQFDRPFHVVSSSPRDLYTIYALEKPLLPGETLNMTFQVVYQTHGFRDGNERPELAENGTFFDSSYFPSIGYNFNLELSDPRRRKEEKLPPLQEMAPRGDPYYGMLNLFTPNADWINYHTIVSTSDDQIAIAPGYLKRDWQQNGRHYYEYDMGQTKTLDFFAFLSGRYAVKRDHWNNVNLEIYYMPGHEYDLQDMLAASKAGLTYFTTNFGPYQFNQYRIMEFPRYREFAQSFANTVPYSEGIGFIGRVKKPEDIDFTYFVTAHELAHQWWGHQLIGGDVQGSNMMAETLAEYSALEVMEKKDGPDQMHKFLRHELDTYLRGRAGEKRHEPPLVLVQREGYVWYQKGGLVMYTLADYIGEDKVNLALRNFLTQYRYANANDSQSVPYPDTRQLVDALRQQTPPQLQYLIHDMFESIVLYDNKMLSATMTETPDKKYKVTLAVQARKFSSDGSGTESPMPLNDYIDIGIFTGKKDHETPLYLQKEKITQAKQTFEIIVNQMPTRAGIDPYNKLIDRIPDDNTINVTKP